MSTFSSTDGVELHYGDVGEGQPVMLMPGFRTPASSWRLQEALLVANGYRVVSLDWRGQGASNGASWGHRISRNAADLATLINHARSTRYPRVIVVGASMGASIGWSYVDLFTSRHLAGFVAVDQTPKMCNEDDWTYGFYGYNTSNFGTYFANGGPDSTGHGTPRTEMGVRSERIDAALHNPVDAEGEVNRAGSLALLRDHATQDWRDALPRVKVPSLHIAGRLSELWPCEHAEATARYNPLARAAVIEDSGHFVHIEQPGPFNQILLSFLRDV